MVAPKFTVAQAEHALMQNLGIVAAAARALGVDHSTLFHRIKNNKRLQDAREQAKEQYHDMALHSMAHNLRNNNVPMTIFALKNFGWTDNNNSAGTATESIAQSMAELLADKT